MYLSHKYKFLFLRTPKTASSSLSDFFIRNIDDPDAIYTEVEDSGLVGTLSEEIVSRYRPYAFYHFTVQQLINEGVLTEEQAREKYHHDLKVFRSHFRPMKETLGGGAGKIFMKMIVVKSTDIVVGCHMVGEHAGEIIQGIAVAMKAGAKKADFDATIGIHPTAAEEFVTMR